MMSIPPISSLAASDAAIDLQDTFKESLGVVRDVAKGVLLKHWGISFDGHNICYEAQQIIAGEGSYNEVLTMRDSAMPAERMTFHNNVQLPYAGNTPTPTSTTTIGSTYQPTMMGQMSSSAHSSHSSPFNMDNNNSHFQSGNSIQNFNNSNLRTQSSFNNITQNQTELPQVASILRAANSYHHHHQHQHQHQHQQQQQQQLLLLQPQQLQQSQNHHHQQQQQQEQQQQQASSSYPSISNNNCHSLAPSSNQRSSQLQQNLLEVEYPRKLENLFPRSNSILALQNTNPTNRSNVQQQMIARLQEGYQSFPNPSYSNSNNQTTYNMPGSAFNLERSSSNASLPYNLSLPPLAPAQRSPHLDNLLIVESRSTTQSRSETPQNFEMVKNTNPKKRKTQTDEEKAAKKAKVNKIDKAEKLEQMKDRAKFNLPVPVWMRILEFCPPIFLRKARLVSREWKTWVDEYQSIHINCRRENFGYNMPEQIPGLSAKQYVDLLGGKGCMEPGCKNKDASRTHWAWKKRWCLKCWKGKIEREDRVHKQNQSTYTRTVMDKLLECIPVSMYDSFGKPHDYVEDSAQPQANQISTHRLYKYYLNADVKRIMEEYEALTPEPWREDPTHDAQQKATARQIWEDKMAKLEEDRDKFFQAKKSENDKLMKLVIQIEAAIREKRAKGRKPNDANRESRKNLFIMAAKRDLPQIPIEFVQTTTAFRAAIRIFRDGGSERGWRTLMPKIEMEFEKSKLKETNQQPTDPASNTQSQANPDQDVQMTGNGFGNFDLDNHNLQRNSQSQILGLPISKSTAFSNDKSFGMANVGASINNRNNFMPSGSQLSNTTPTTFLGGRPLIPSNHGLNGNASASTMSLGSSHRVSLNNNSSVGFPINFPHTGESFPTNLLSHLLQSNAGSSRSVTPLSQNNTGSSVNVSRLNNGFQNNNGSSIISGNPSTYASQNNINSSTGSSASLSSHAAYNNNNSSLVPTNSSSVGSSSTPRATMSIASLITRTQSQHN